MKTTIVCLLACLVAVQCMEIKYRDCKDCKKFVIRTHPLYKGGISTEPEKVVPPIKSSTYQTKIIWIANSSKHRNGSNFKKFLLIYCFIY